MLILISIAVLKNILKNEFEAKHHRNSSKKENL
jgi:hypothetical protein